MEIVTFIIEGDTSSVEDVVVNWERAGQVVGTCRVFTNPRSSIAQDSFRELRREKNRQWIDQGKANALDPDE